ncbi:hypothetical protein D3C71_2106590 [compost metagenome]
MSICPKISTVRALNRFDCTAANGGGALSFDFSSGSCSGSSSKRVYPSCAIVFELPEVGVSTGGLWLAGAWDVGWGPNHATRFST